MVSKSTPKNAASREAKAKLDRFQEREQQFARLREKAADEMLEDLAAPVSSAGTMQTGTARKALSDNFLAELTPSRALRALRAARDLTDVAFFVDVAMDSLHQDPHVYSLLQTRALALSSLPLLSEPVNESAQDSAAHAQAVAILSSESVESALPHLTASYLYLGVGVAQIFAEQTARKWVFKRLQPVDPRFITIDKNDARTPLLQPTVTGEPPAPLEEGRFVYITGGLIDGNPLTKGFAYQRLFHKALADMALNGWSAYAELYAQPLRLGKYPQGMNSTTAGKKDLAVMKRALRDLGQDAWAMLPENMKIEIVEAANKGGSIEVYEKLVRYFDELHAKLILGGTLTNGTGQNGGSYGLGKVHNELRGDLMRADGKRVANALRRFLIAPFTAWNIGAGVETPKVYFQVDDAADVAAKVKAICDLTDRGWAVPTAELYSLLDVRKPEAGEDVIGGRKAAAEGQKPGRAEGKADDAPDAGKAAMTAQLSAAQAEADALDELALQLLSSEEYSESAILADEALLTAIESVTDAKALKEALTRAILTGDVSALQAALVAPIGSAAAAGLAGAEIG